MKELAIIDFREELASEFVKINLEWMTSDFYNKHFAVEEHDRTVLADPIAQIILKGGHILFAEYKNKIVGTLALVARKKNTFELSKLAVMQDYRGMKISDELMKAAIEYSVSQGKKTIWLESIKILKPAIALFKKFGFREIPLNSKPLYAKADIKMSLAL